MAARSYPYAFHVALDGSGLNGLEGRAGVCIFRYDPADNAYAHKVSYFPGVAGGHAVSVSPERTIGFLGNTGQHLLFYDPASLDEADRISTMRFEVTDHSLKASTHLVWLDDVQFVTAIGEHLWKFDVNRLNKAEQIAPHQLKLPHAMKRTASGRYVVYGGMDHPDRGEAREVGILDLVTGESASGRACRRPAGTSPPTRARTCSTRCRSASSPQDGQRLARVGHGVLQGVRLRDRRRDGRGRPALGRRPRGPGAHQLRRHDVLDGAHLLHRRQPERRVASTSRRFADFRILDERPDVATQAAAFGRAAATQVVEPRSAAARPSRAASTTLSALRVSRGSLLDSVYACQLSADQSLLFTANRGLNSITVYDYPSPRRPTASPDARAAGVRRGPFPPGRIPSLGLPPQLPGQPGPGRARRARSDMADYSVDVNNSGSVDVDSDVTSTVWTTSRSTPRCTVGRR